MFRCNRFVFTTERSNHAQCSQVVWVSPNVCVILNELIHFAFLFKLLSYNLRTNNIIYISITLLYDDTSQRLP